MGGDKETIRKLTQWLFFSGALNIILCTLFFYGMIRERAPTPYFEAKPANRDEQQAPLAIDHSNAEMIRQFKKLSIEQLVAKLANSQQVENGYTQRDLALACLVTFHYFDISRALLGHAQPSQHRAIQFDVRKDGSPAKVLAYPELSEEQYQAIIHFANTERWPLTARGLYYSLKKSENKDDPTLAEAFYLTPEFLGVELLLTRSEVSFKKDELLRLLLDGTWQMLYSFSEQQKQTQDLSPARRQYFLLQYIEKGSKTAAYALLLTDGPYSVRKLDDTHIKTMLSLLSEKTPESEKFALALLTSPRGNAVWRLAADRLYEYAGEPKPEKFEHRAALARFIPQHGMLKAAAPKAKEVAEAEVSPITTIKEAPAKNVAPLKPVDKGGSALKSPLAKLPPRKADRLYIVQEGDSLWKISRRFKVEVDVLKKHNKLSNDLLKPGTALRIP